MYKNSNVCFFFKLSLHASTVLWEDTKRTINGSSRRIKDLLKPSGLPRSTKNAITSIYEQFLRLFSFIVSDRVKYALLTGLNMRIKDRK